MAGAQAPQLIEPMRDQFVDEGSPTTFKCKIVANPPPVIQVELQKYVLLDKISFLGSKTPSLLWV